MKTLIVFTLVAAFLIAANCGTVQPARTTMGDTGTDYSAVCAHLAAIGCGDGEAPNCADTFGTIETARRGDLRPGCLLAAQTVLAAITCGSVECR